MNIEKYNIYYNILKKNNYIEQDHWNIFDKTYYYIIEDINNLKHFRRNGISNMLETGLPSQERQKLLVEQLEYNILYNENEKDEIIKRFNELVLMMNDQIEYLFFNNEIGSPQRYIHNYKGRKYLLNFDDLYQVYAAWQLNRFIHKIYDNKIKIILEIGGGYGNLAHKMKQLYKKSKYIIVDLPEVLLLQHYYLINNNSEYKIINLIDNSTEIDVENDNFDILLIPFNLYNKYKFKCDIIINMRSMGEMPKKDLYNYIYWIEENMKIGGLFYNVNRYVFTKSIDKNKIRDCPYDNYWKIIVSQPQWLQTHLHEFILQRSSTVSTISFKFLLQSFPISTPPPGPIMPKILTQDSWMKYQKISQ